MKILFINLSDPGVLGKKSAEALEKKHKPSFWSKDKSKVTVVNLMWDAIEFARSGTVDLTERDASAINAWLKKRDEKDKVIVAAHGKKEDTIFCYAESDPEELFKTHPLMNYTQLAQFVKTLLKVRPSSDPFNMTLSICYGARSKEHEKDHIQQLSEVDICSSFAAKFYALMLKDCDLRLKAVTGSVQFDASSGSLLVQSEEVIKAEQNYDKALRALKEYSDKMAPLKKEFADAYGDDAWIDYIKDNLYEKNITPLDKAMSEFNQMQAQFELLRQQKNELSQKKYGQIVFTYNPKTELISIQLVHRGKEALLTTAKITDFIEEIDLKEPDQNNLGYPSA